MTAQYVLPLNDEQATLETVGGKGASLARLTRAGLPVPSGFHVTTDAYRAFVAANDLQPAILAALAGANPADPASLEAASSHIHHLFAEARVPADIAAAIRSAYAALTNPQSPIPNPQSPIPCRRPLLCHRRRPAGSLLRGTTGNLPQRQRRGRGADCHGEVLGLALDGARHRLSRPPGDRAGERGVGRGGAAACAG
jgi:hypothetical protein